MRQAWGAAPADRTSLTLRVMLPPLRRPRQISCILFIVLLVTTFAHGEQQRTLQSNLPQLNDAPLGEYATVRLSLSLWDPQVLSGDELVNVVSERTLQRNVVHSLEQVMCSVSDTRIINRAAALFDESLLDDYDVCVQSFGRKTNNVPGRRVSVLQSQPEIEIVQVTRYGVLWSLWSVSWTVLRVGDLYVSEAIMNNPYVAITDVEELAVQAMEQVAQLSLNINIMEDEFDATLQDNLKNRRLYASVTSEEIETFAAAAIDYENRFMFSPRGWYPMRIFGLSLLGGTFLLHLILMSVAGCRRRQLERAATKGPGTLSVVNLGSADYVDKLLQQSPSANLLVPRIASYGDARDNILPSCPDDDEDPSIISSLGDPYGFEVDEETAETHRHPKSLGHQLMHA